MSDDDDTRTKQQSGTAKPLPSTRGSPSVSELSSVVGNGSGSIRSTVGDETESRQVVYSPSDSPDTSVIRRNGHVDNEEIMENVVSTADISDVESLSSTTVDSLDEQSDVESERSTSETYYADLGGDIVLDNSDWELVIPQHEITRTYSSDIDDGGACPDIVSDSDSDDLDGIPLQLPNPPSDYSLEEDEVIVESVELSDNDHIIINSDDDEESEHLTPPHVTMDELKSTTSTYSLEDDDVVKVSLSDGEEVLSEEEDEDEKREKMMIALGMKRTPSWSLQQDENEEKKMVVDHGITTPRRSRVGLIGTGQHCSRREVLMERLRTVRTALQMVQVDTAAKSASAQLEAGEGARTEMSETKSKAKRELAALSATLDFLAKMALQKAIELEAFQEQRSGNGCAR